VQHLLRDAVERFLRLQRRVRLLAHGLVVEAALGEEPNAPLEAKEALHRIAQEVLHNAAKHARAAAVTLRLARGAAGLVLEIGDDGVGFDPTDPFPGHLGLRSMRERAERLGGTLVIESAPGQGARVRAEIPC
jgi:signal transduction histidine kinase